MVGPYHSNKMWNNKFYWWYLSLVPFYKMNYDFFFHEFS